MPTAVVVGAGTVGLSVLKKYVRLLGRLPTVVFSTASPRRAGADLLEPIIAAWRKGSTSFALRGLAMVSVDLSEHSPCPPLTLGLSCSRRLVG